MGLIDAAKNLIRTLISNRFYTQCPSCGDESRLSDWGLFYLDDFTPAAEELYRQMLADLRERKKELQRRRLLKSKQSQTGAKAVNIGFILERLAPSLRQFKFNHNDCRSLFDPIV